MNKASGFSEFLTQNSPEISVLPFVGGLLATGLLCFLLSYVYARRGHSLSNRESFGRNFVVIGMTTMLIITVVKASLALSLGLVGALSIVRFRTAIKEPEELGYLFLVISVGLGYGASQWVITTTAVLLIVTVLWIRGRPAEQSGAAEYTNLFLTVSSEGAGKVGLEKITEALRGAGAGLALKRFDETHEGIEASYLVRFKDYAQVEQARAAIMSQGEQLRVTFVDNAGVV